MIEKIHSDSDDLIDLRRLMAIIWGNKMVVLSVVVLTSFLSVIIALSMQDRYASVSLLAPKNEDAGGLGGLARQYSGLASMAGISVPDPEKGGKIEIALQTMGSFDFFKNNIYDEYVSALFAATGWDKEKNKLTFDESLYDIETLQWVSKPSAQTAYSSFLEQFSFSEDVETGFISVKMEHFSPFVAKEVVSSIVKRINETMRQRDIAEAEEAITFLNEKIKETPLNSLDEMFARLIEDQIKTIMLANVSEDYIFRTIEPPVVAERKASPQRALICLIGAIFGGVLGVLLALTREALRTRSEITP